MVTVQRYNSFFNMQIFWEKFLVRDRETYCLNSKRVPIFYPKKAPKKGDVFAKQQTRLCLFVPIWSQKNSLQIIRRLFLSKRGKVFLQ